MSRPKARLQADLYVFLATGGIATVLGPEAGRAPEDDDGGCR